VVLVGAIHGAFEDNTESLARQLLAHFQAYPAEVPPGVSLWIIPAANPDGLANDTRWNGHQVDLNRNADTDLDGCAGNDWRTDTQTSEGKHPAAGGPYPFSEPESRALRDFLADARIAVFYHGAAGAIFGDSCARHRPTARLAAVLAGGTGYPVPSEGWTGYPITGDFGDYLAGEGIAAATVELTDHDAPEFERNLAGVQAVLAAVDEIVAADAAAAGGEYTSLATDGAQANTGTWSYAPGTFVHPQALEVISDTAYVLDGGRVLALDLAQEAPPRLLLAAGDAVPWPATAGERTAVTVLELLDLAADGPAGRDGLLALDRAGDVYHYDWRTRSWTVERYDRPSGTQGDHYFVALGTENASRYLLETSHERVWRFTGQERGTVWAALPKARDVDLAAAGGAVYVLTRGLNNPIATLARYANGKAVAGFKPAVSLQHPRQVQAGAGAVYVLDQGGRRLLALDSTRGTLRTLYQFPDRRAAGAVWVGPDGELILAGRDALYFYGRPERRAAVAAGPPASGPQSYDPAVLDSLRGLAMPIQGAHLTGRDFQIPGAPRHYRLGVHQGVDFYGYAVGVKVDRSTSVHAVADGVVIRADRSYKPLTRAQAAAWDAECRRLGYTPDDVLDGYRGQQVWIEHAGGLVSRYAHLSSIAPGIEAGAAVTRGQVIATVGNSGTPDGLAGPNVGLHLHLELWLGDHYVGQFMRPLETREWLERILR
jgi:murein DD-endopeptidase MepM/ murein hydrolase activator NlpD